MWCVQLLGPIAEQDRGKKTLVLDLDETLVHSSFRPVPNPDFVIPVEIEGKVVDVYVLKRPWMDEFMASVGHRFEVGFTPSDLAQAISPPPLSLCDNILAAPGPSFLSHLLSLTPPPLLSNSLHVLPAMSQQLIVYARSHSSLIYFNGAPEYCGVKEGLTKRNPNMPVFGII